MKIPPHPPKKYCIKILILTTLSLSPLASWKEISSPVSPPLPHSRTFTKPGRFGEIFGLLAALVTTPGVFVLIAFGIYRLAFVVARSMVYPGHLRVVTRMMERELGANFQARTVHATVEIGKFLELLVLPTNSAPPSTWCSFFLFPPFRKTSDRPQ